MTIVRICARVSLLNIIAVTYVKGTMARTKTKPMTHAPSYNSSAISPIMRMMIIGIPTLTRSVNIFAIQYPGMLMPDTFCMCLRLLMRSWMMKDTMAVGIMHIATAAMKTKLPCFDYSSLSLIYASFGYGCVVTLYL